MAHVEFGQIISEYRQDWKLDTIPRYLFNAKELDEESQLYYYEARYHDPNWGVFNSRDQKFEKYFWMSPYAYCANNPIKYVDPTGMTVEERNAAVKYMRGIIGTPYSSGNVDCSGTVGRAVVFAGLPNPVSTGKGANGVARIASTSTKVDISEMRVGDAATFRTGREHHQGKDGEFDHIGIISKINKDDDGNITSFNFIHASNGGVQEQTYDMKKGLSGYDLKNVYQWDTPDDPATSTTTNPYPYYNSDIFKPTEVYQGQSSIGPAGDAPRQKASQRLKSSPNLIPQKIGHLLDMFGL